MCDSSPPKAPPPTPAPPPPEIPILKTAEQDTSRNTAALKANKGRSSLRIDRTQNAPGSAGSGLNIPT